MSDQNQPARIVGNRGEMLDAARKYMDDTYGPLSESSDKDRWLERYGLLIGFVCENFPTTT